jgi:hypothetical protein
MVTFNDAGHLAGAAIPAESRHVAVPSPVGDA